MSSLSSRPGGTRRLVAPELLPALDFLPSFDFNEQVLHTIRAGIGIDPQKRPPLMPEQQAVACEQRFIPGPAGAPDVRLLVYTPPGPPKMGAATMRPAYLHMHGGGYVIGNPEINDGSNRSIAAELDCVVVSVAYRLAPETRFPGALEDCYAALMWLQSEAEQLRVDRSRIAVGGESAGGGHAAALAILARKRGAAQICLQLLDSPMLDDRTGSALDPHPHCGEFVWTAASNRFGWRSLLGVEPGTAAVPPDAAPARAADLTGLPPAFITVGALDLFVEEDLEYARRLIRSGVPAELHVIPGAFHGFGVAGGQAPQVQAYMRLRSDALARALAPHRTSG
jgi:acetyl esterase/lipase